jgi:hypothetical protein
MFAFDERGFIVFPYYIFPIASYFYLIKYALSTSPSVAKDVPVNVKVAVTVCPAVRLLKQTACPAGFAMPAQPTELTVVPSTEHLANAG